MLQGSEMAGRAACGHGAATGLGARDRRGEAHLWKQNDTDCRQVLGRGCAGQSRPVLSSPTLRSQSQQEGTTGLWYQGILDLKRTRRDPLSPIPAQAGEKQQPTREYLGSLSWVPGSQLPSTELILVAL